MTSAISGASAGCAPRSRSRARGRRRGSSRPSRPSVRNATRPASVRRKRSSRGAAPGRLAHDPLDGGRRRRRPRSPSDGSVSGSRCVWTASSSGTAARIARLELLGHFVRLLERHAAGQLEVERELECGRRPRRALTLWISRTPGTAAPPRARARGRRARSRGSTCTTTSLPGSARSTASSTASAAAWPWPTAADRRDADHDVRELAAARLAHPQPAQLDRRARARRSPRAPPPRRRPARGPSARRCCRGSAARPRAARARRRRAPRPSRRSGSRRARAAGRRARRPSRRGRSPKCSAFEASAALCSAATRATRRLARLTSIAITTHDHREHPPASRRPWACPSRSAARSRATPMKTLASARNAASASAARCSALPWPYWCEWSAGRPATPTAKNVSSAATRSVPECDRLGDEAEAVRRPGRR